MDLFWLIAWKPPHRAVWEGFEFEAGFSLAEVRSNVSETKAYLFEPQKRSERVMSVVKALYYRKVPFERIVGIITDPDYGVSAHVLDQSDPLAYAWHQLRNLEPYDQPEPETPNEELRPFKSLFPLPSVIPYMPWCIPGVLLDGHLTILGGRGGAGKSLFELHMAIAVALGKDFLHWQVATEPRRVLILNCEDPEDILQRRFFSIVQEMELSPEEYALLASNVMFDDRPDGRFAMFALNYDDKGNKEIVDTDYFKDLKRRVAKFQVGLLLADPLVELHTGLDENSNTDMKEVALGLRRLARDCRIPVLAAHHTRKGQAAEGAEQDAFRGGGSLVNAARIAMLMEPATEDDMKVLGLRAEDKTRFVSVSDPKQNYFSKAGVKFLEIKAHEVNDRETGPAFALAVPKEVDEHSTPDQWLHTDTVLEMVAKADPPYTTASSGKRKYRLDAAVEDLAEISLDHARKWIAKLEQHGLIHRAEWVDGNRNKKEVWRKSVPQEGIPF